MAVFLVSKTINIKSYKGEYIVSFISGYINNLNDEIDINSFYIVDKNIAKIYIDELSNILNSNRVMVLR